jgi:ABC-2 type transport system ATP-binding protein
MFRSDNMPPVAGETIVALKKVSRYFDNLWGGSLVLALTNVSIEIRRGEVFGLVGPASSGKSTLLKIVAGLLRPSEGAVKVLKHSPSRRAIKVRIAYAPMRPAAASGFVPVHHSLAHALAKPKDLLVLDEPFLGLDAAAVCQVKDRIAAWTQPGNTVLLSGRSLSDVQGVCSRIAILWGGRIEAVGTIEELLLKSGSLRSLASVLPSTLEERLLEVIRKELASDSGQFRADNLASRELRSGTEGNDLAVAASNPALDRLAEKPTPPRSPPASESTIDPVDHRKLTNLLGPSGRQSMPPPPHHQ